MNNFIAILDGAGNAFIFCVWITYSFVLDGVGRSVFFEGAAVFERGRIGCIDGLRGYLSLSVIGSHFLFAINFAASGSWQGPVMFIFSSLGPVAVSCFFMITALLFYRRIVLDHRKVEWLGLYRSRICRLLPAYAISVVCVIAVASYMTSSFPKMDGGNLKALFAWVTFTIPGPREFNDYDGTGAIVAGVTWTLRYEWLFYLFLPVMMLVFRSFNEPKLRIVLLIGLIAVGYTFPDLSAWSFSTHICTVFIFGMLTAELQARSEQLSFLKGTAGAVFGFVALFASFCFEKYSALQVIASFFFFLPVALGNSYWGIFSRGEAVVLGNASYSIYLFHGIILFVVAHTFVSSADVSAHPTLWALLPIAGVLTTAFSIAVYTLVEVRFIAIGKQKEMTFLNRPSA